MAISAAWHCDERAMHQSQLLATFFANQGVAAISNGYSIQGRPLHIQERENACSEQCFVVTAAATLVTGSLDMSKRAEFWRGSAQEPGPEQSCYFCDVLRLLSLVFTSGLMHEPIVNANGPVPRSSAIAGMASTSPKTVTSLSAAAGLSTRVATSVNSKELVTTMVRSHPRTTTAEAVEQGKTTAVASAKPSAVWAAVTNEHGLCLESSDRATHAGEVLLKTCDPGNTKQQWVFDQKNHIMRDHLGDCLDTSYGAKTSSLSPVGMWHCNLKNLNQRWTYKDDARLLVTGQRINNEMLCLCGWQGAKSGYPVKIKFCSANDTEQHWTFSHSFFKQ